MRAVFGHAANFSSEGSIHFLCTHWPRAKEVILAGEEIYGKPKDLCIWNQTNAGARAGSFYLPSHELVFVFRVGNAASNNDAALGCRRRNRTNVWNYQDVPNASAKSTLGLRLGTKPVAMVADAIRDCSNRGAVILDPFGGAGTTLIAAEQTGRRARLIEPDPMLVEVAIERWQRLTGHFARHSDTGRPFARPANADIPTESE
jgi:hypothetical protein